MCPGTCLLQAWMHERLLKNKNEFVLKMLQDAWFLLCYKRLAQLLDNVMSCGALALDSSWWVTVSMLNKPNTSFSSKPQKKKKATN